MDEVAVELGLVWISWILIGGEEVEQQEYEPKLEAELQQHAKAERGRVRRQEARWLWKPQEGLGTYYAANKGPLRVLRGKHSDGFHNRPENQEISTQKGG